MTSTEIINEAAQRHRDDAERCFRRAGALQMQAQVAVGGALCLAIHRHAKDVEKLGDVHILCANLIESMGE
jgi:hypothetical protein